MGNKNINLTKNDKKEQVRQIAEGSLEAFIRLVHPKRALGAIHIELINWWTRSDANSHQLALLPRDHQKSAMIAYRVVWEITKNPAIRVLYISSTQNLATKQLKFIKDILTSETYLYYWPNMINREEGQREKWNETEISVDHPKRKEEAIRDPTIFTAGLTTTIVGMHCDIAVLDDVVIYDNANTEEGREKVKSQYSLLSSIEGTDSREWSVGTRYHPKDLYNDILQLTVDKFDDEGELESQVPLYEVFERKVESRGDGTGEFLWPRQQNKDGTWYGFNQDILAKKRAQYLNKAQFRAQYYNDPNDPDNEAIPRDSFQYYDRSHVSRIDGRYFYKGNRLNVFAAIDFAFTLKKTSDYSSVVVVGMDGKNNYYVLDIDRFKTDQISEYFNRILRLHAKWDFRKIRAEVTSAQQVIVNDLKMNYIRVHGLALSIDEFKPTGREGSKEERVHNVLQPKYANRQMWHYQGGNCQILEDELVLRKPPHDDVKDCLASCLEICTPPSHQLGNSGDQMRKMRSMTHSRFGGIK